MGKMVNGKWNELAVDDYQGDTGSSVPAPASSPAPTQSAPAPQQFDTNTYAQRQALRDQGYFIDDSGVYAPGAGQRVQSTWSGDQTSRNVAPSPTQIPILNGTPVSPSNGFTGNQTDAIMYRGDPLYGRYFGRGTPGYSSTSRTYNATPGDLPDGQGTYQIRPMAPQPATPTVGGVPTPQDGQSAPAPTALATDQTAPPQQDAGISPDYASQWQNINQDENGVPYYGPYQTQEAPQLKVDTRYTEGNNIIEKSTDQYGNPYYQTVGQVGGNQVDAAPAAVTAPNPGTPQQPQPGTPAQLAPAGSNQHTMLGPDGKAYQLTLSDEDYQNVLHDQQSAAQAVKDAQQFQQGLDKGKLDLDKAIAAWNQTYQQSLLQQQDRTAANDQAYKMMLIELQKQAQELQRQQQGQTVAMEHEKLALAQRQARGQRRLPGVRIK